MAHTAQAAPFVFTSYKLGLAMALRTNAELISNGAMNFFIVIFRLSIRKARGMNAPCLRSLEVSQRLSYGTTVCLASQEGRRTDFYFKKTSTPHSLMTTYLMNLISALSISLDSTFKRPAVTHVCSSSCPSRQYACPYNYLSVCLPFFLRNLLSTKYKYHESTKDLAKYRPY
jgi:hypothetical protein